MNKFDRLCEFFKRSIKVHTNYSKKQRKKNSTSSPMDAKKPISTF